MAKIKPSDLITGFYGGAKGAKLEQFVQVFIEKLKTPETLSIIHLIDYINDKIAA